MHVMNKEMTNSFHWKTQKKTQSKLIAINCVMFHDGKILEKFQNQ